MLKKILLLTLLMLVQLSLVSCESNKNILEETSTISSSNTQPQTEVTKLLTSEATQKPSNDNRVAYDRNQYIMDLSLDDKNKCISGTIRVIVVNDSKDVWHKLCFRDYVVPVINQYQYDMDNDLNPDITAKPTDKKLNSKITDVKEVKSNKSLAIEASEADDSVLFVDLETPLQPNGQIEIEMNYVADIPHCRYRFAYHTFDNGKTSFELGNFYPVLAVYEDGNWVTHPYPDIGECFYSKCSDYKVSFLAPEGYTVIASGKEKLVKTGSGVSTWELDAENMRDFTITASNNLEKISQKLDGITINSYYFITDGRIDHKIFGQAALHAGSKSMRIFNNDFGNYPYDELDIVETYLWAGGMEYPAFVRMSSMIAGFLKEPDAEMAKQTGMLQPMVENAVAHEVGHEWFYGVIGNDEYAEGWLDESFASFSALLFKKSYMSDNEFSKEIDLTSPPQYINLPVDKYSNMTYANALYGQGQIFLYKLYQLMGDADFFRMMQDYYRAFMFKEVHTNDFISYIYKYAPDNKEIESLINNYIKR